MHQETIERVLACEDLPTLPAVATRVVSLTSDPDLKMQDLVTTIEHDQALAAKVLRTINSSFFGLRSKCTTINQAIVMLGLSAVKCLALGFSLVDTLKDERPGEFDYAGFWRRSIYTGVAARHVARTIGADWEDEAFLGGLLQDIGVVAMYRALGSDYAEIVRAAKGRHQDLVRHELAALEVQHPEIGAMLASRWRLPDELVLPIRYHERPTAAPASVADQVRAIALGNLVHDVLTEARPSKALAAFEERALSWFRLDPKQATMLIREVGASISEVTDIFQLDAGQAVDVEAVLKAADEQMVQITRHGADVEPASGLEPRSRFDEIVDRMLDGAVQRDVPFAVLLLGLDGFEMVRRSGEHEGADALGAVAEEARRAAEDQATIACFAGDTIGVILPGATRLEAERVSGGIRAALARREAPDSLTVSSGIVAVGRAEGRLFAGGGALQAAAMRALDAARVVGGDCERTFVPRRAA